jgi:hypothetical protein
MGADRSDRPFRGFLPGKTTPRDLYQTKVIAKLLKVGGVMNLLKTSFLGLAATVLSTAALAASLVQTGTLKDFQTVGSTTKKQKHQQYDLVVDTSTNEYVCRTKLGNSVKPTQFVVGSTLEFKVNGQNGEATNTSGNKVKCAIVRVAASTPAQTTPTQ